MALLTPEPASAQFFGPGPGPGMPPFVVRRAVQAQGFRVLAPPFRRGEVYVVDAVDGDGRQVRLIVDAYEGTIVRSFGVRERPLPPGRPVVTGERLPFPGETRFPDEGVRRSRGSDGGGGLFGFFPRSSPSPDSPRAERGTGEPRVIPGIGPDKPKPHHVVRPKPPSRTAVRAAPPPLPGPQVIPAPAVVRPSETVRPAPAKAVPPPPPKAVQPPAPVAKKELPPPAPVAKKEAPPAPKPIEARVPSKPERDAPSTSTPRPQNTQGGTPPKAGDDKPAPQKVGAAKKRSGPLNDIPPAPLE